jgi:histidine triad (HIT) family protein
LLGASENDPRNHTKKTPKLVRVISCDLVDREFIYSTSKRLGQALKMPASNAATCLFCKIAAGEVATRLVFEDATSIAFLDHRPVFPGHCLLIPKQHYETLTDLPEELIGPFFKGAQRLAGAVESAMEAHGTFVAMNNRVSQSVPHLHLHIVPRRRKDGLKGFFWPRYPYPGDEAADAVQFAIRQALTVFS